jgi:glycosyltransferase involved in cell wall biosynthesis
MKVAHVVGYLHEEASGPAQSVMRLAESQADLGCEVDLCCVQPGRTPVGTRQSIFPELRRNDGFAFAPSLIPGLISRSRSVKVIHNHSLWAFPNLVAGWVGGVGRAALVTSPRGTLSPQAMQFSRTKKRWAWWAQRPAVAWADCLHATSKMEALDLRTFGLRKPIAVIPNGIDIPAESSLRRNGVSNRRTILFLGRLHPIKGLDILLKSWANVGKCYPDWDLEIVGKGDPEFVTALEEMVRELNLSRIRFHSEIYGEQKIAKYVSADLFVLPSRSENFGMAVAESLACGIPVITTDSTPWRGLLDERCGWWIKPDVDALTAAMHEAVSASEGDRQAMGHRGRAWMRRDFSWYSVASRMNKVYEWIVSGGSCPEWVDQ